MVATFSKAKITKNTKGTIIWLEDPNKFSYLRERRMCFFRAVFPVRTIGNKIGGFKKLVGYEYLDHRGSFEFLFRFWWLKQYDRDLEPDGAYAKGFPVEAVVPSSIESGKPSTYLSGYSRNY